MYQACVPYLGFCADKTKTATSHGTKLEPVVFILGKEWCVFSSRSVYIYIWHFANVTISWDYQERKVDLFPWSWNASKYYVDFFTSLGKCLLASQLNIQIMQTIILFSIINAPPTLCLFWLLFGNKTGVFPYSWS